VTQDNIVLKNSFTLGFTHKQTPPMPSLLKHCAKPFETYNSLKMEARVNLAISKFQFFLTHFNKVA